MFHPHLRYPFLVAVDVMEENALNEKSCVQVLHILISKADTEIYELEQDLVSLQSELAWGEDEEWSEFCHNALTEKINCLDISIRGLRNTNENDVEVQLLMHREPAEGVHEIVKALLRNYFQKKDEQPAEIAIKNLSKNVLPHAIGHSNKKEMLSDSNLKITSEKVEEHNSAPTADDIILDSSSKLDEKRTDHGEMVKPAEIAIINSSKNVLPHLIGHSNKKETLSDSNLKIMSEEVVEHNSTPMADDIILGSSSKPDEKRTDHGEKVKPAEIEIINSSKKVLPHPIGHSNKMETLSNSNFKIKSEVVEEYNSTPTADDIILGSSSKPDEKRTDHGEKVKPAEIAIKNSSKNVLPHAIGHPNEKKTLSDSNLKIKSEEVEEHNSTPTADDIILGSSSKPDEKRTDHSEMVKPTEIAIKNSSKIVLPHPIGHSNKKEMLSNSNLKIKSEEVEEHNSTPTADDVILSSSYKPDIKKTDHGEKVKPAISIGKDSSTGAVRDVAGCSLGKSDMNVSGNEEVREYDSTAADKNKISISSSSPEGKGTVLKTDKPANAIVKGSSAEESRHAAGFNRRENGSDTKLGAFRQAESGNSDLEVKLSDFAVKIARKGCIKGLKIAPTDKIDSPDSSAKTECKREIPPQRVKVKVTGHFSLTSPLEMPNQRKQEATELQQMEERKSQAEEVNRAEVASNGKKPILNSSPKPRKLKEKRKIESDTPRIEEPAFSSIEVVSDSNISKTKTKRKSGVSTDILILNQSPNGKVMKGLVQATQCEVKEPSVGPDDSNTRLSSIEIVSDSSSKSKTKRKSRVSSDIVILNQSLNGKVMKGIVQPGQCEVKEPNVSSDDSKISKSQKKRKRISNSPITAKIEGSTVHKDLPNLTGNATDDVSKENLQIIKFSSGDSHTEALAPEVLYLKKKKLIDLKAIAKEHDLTNYSKLKKEVLIGRILDRMGCC
ncbi:hypothetical protein FCV25MIE_14249 [Fagus crenata]